LFSLCLLFCFVVVNAQPAVRTVYAASNGGILNNRVCYIVSAEYAVIPNQSITGDVFGAAMGLNIPLTSALYPWTILGYVRGSVDATTYPSTGTLSQVQVDAQANVVAWSYYALGEYCDANGIEGYQPGAVDYIINYYTAPEALLYDFNCGTQNDPITGDVSYFGSIQTTGSNIFNNSCRVFPKNTTVMRNGRIVSPYDFKCDIRIDYSTLWTNNSALIKGCPDTQRKIGLLVNIAAGSFDVSTTVANLNNAVANTPDGQRLTFSAGRLQFAWDNYYVKTTSFPSITGVNGAVTATSLGVQTLDSSTTIYGVRAVEQVIFTFDAPKSAGTLYYWDPTTSVMGTGAGVTGAAFSMLVMCFVAFFLSF